MGNPFYNQNAPQQMPNNPFGNMMQLMQQFQQFANNFKGNPEQRLQEMLNSGQMSQQQYNQCSQLAQQFQNMFKFKR